MSQYYDKASLVVVPSGYKAGTVYAQKPLTTDGQLAFTRTGDTATRVNSAGLIVPVLANVPRLDYLGSTCPRLLLEPQRTNSVLFSEQFTNAAWADAGGTVTANTAISPSGYQDADTLTGARYQGGGAANQYTLSCFAKKVNGDGKFVLRVDVPTLNFAQFNLNNGTIDSTSAGYTSTITSVGNGWYRCTLTTPVSTTISNFVLVSATGASFSTYVWGAQSEIGAYATSYIPTLAASATRGADACSKTGISSLIGQTEGVVFVEAANLFPSGSRTIALLYTSGSAFYQVYINASNQFRVDVNGSFLFLGGSIAANTNYKIAFAYKSGEYALYINGAQIATSASTTMPSSLTAYYLGNSIGSEQSGAFSQALLFKTRLTNAELAELTTL